MWRMTSLGRSPLACERSASLSRRWRLTIGATALQYFLDTARRAKELAEVGSSIREEQPRWPLISLVKSRRGDGGESPVLAD